MKTFISGCSPCHFSQFSHIYVIPVPAIFLRPDTNPHVQQSPLPSARSWQDLCSFPRGCILGDPGPLAALWIHPTPAPGLGGLQSDDRQAGKAQHTRTKRRSVSRLAKGPGSCLDPAHVPAGSSDGTNLNAHAPRGGEWHTRSARAGGLRASCSFSQPPLASISNNWA